MFNVPSFTESVAGIKGFFLASEAALWSTEC